MLPPSGLKGQFRDDSRTRAAYSEGAGIYRILPRAVCLPRDEADLIRLMSWAVDSGIPLIPRGAGSAMGGGNVGEGVIVDLTQLTDRRLQVEAGPRRAITSAGVTLGQLNDAAAAYGLRLPPDPSSGAWATLGGMVSTNAAGPRSVRYGSVRQWVESLALITADGESVTLRRGTPPTASSAIRRFYQDAAPAILRESAQIESRFPHTTKNSSGYALDSFVESGDVLDLMIGSEGTLGIVTEVEWRLDHSPSHRAGLRASLRSVDSLSEAVRATLPSQPSAIELLDRTFLDLLAGDTLAGAAFRFGEAEAVLLIEIERDDPDSLREALHLATARLRPIAHAVDTAFTPEAAERLWSIRRAASPILAGLPEQRRSLQVIEDACLPIDQMGRYLRFVRQASTARDIPVVMFGHAGDGHIHVNLLPDTHRAGWEGSVAGLLEEVTECVVELGGTPSGEHGDGRLRAHLLERVFGREIVSLFGLVKNSFDPRGILNPGVILPSDQPAISRLKVGQGAVFIPSDVELALREIERTGGYGRNRLEIADGSRQPATRYISHMPLQSTPQTPDSRLQAVDSAMEIIRAPRVTLVARPQFLEPAHLPVQWKGESTDGERIAEFAGRLCYMSQHNPAGRSTAEYLQNILKQGHGSVFEHSTYVVLIEGISRSCSHELVRHRAGWGFSQLSQRYVDESHAAFVMPPAIMGDAALEEAWTRQVEQAQAAYVEAVERLMARYDWVENKVHRRKLAREAARSVLPNATEVKIVVSANVRAWRTMLELRLGEGAELEIRRMAAACLRVLQREAPALFADFELYESGEGGEAGRVGFHKV
jgi:thymidylate synthase (FAD)